MKLLQLAFVSGDSILNGGEEAVLRVYYDYSITTKYQFFCGFFQGKQIFSVYRLPPQESSITFKMEWGTETVNDVFTQVNLEKQVC